MEATEPQALALQSRPPPAPPRRKHAHHTRASRKRGPPERNQQRDQHDVDPLATSQGSTGSDASHRRYLARLERAREANDFFIPPENWASQDEEEEHDEHEHDTIEETPSNEGNEDAFSENFVLAATMPTPAPPTTTNTASQSSQSSSSSTATEWHHLTQELSSQAEAEVRDIRTNVTLAVEHVCAEQDRIENKRLRALHEDVHLFAARVQERQYNIWGSAAEVERHTMMQSQNLQHALQAAGAAGSSSSSSSNNNTQTEISSSSL